MNSIEKSLIGWPKFGPDHRCHKCKAQAAIFHNNVYWCGECYLNKPTLEPKSTPTQNEPTSTNPTI